MIQFKIIALEYIPSVITKAFHESYAKLNLNEDELENEANIVNIKRENSIDKLLQLKNIKVETKPSSSHLLEKQGIDVEDVELADNEDYTLPPGKLTYKSACQILEVYKRNGRVSHDSVHRILRAGFRSLQSMSNISRVELEHENERLTVVGDLHGQLPDLIHIFDESGLPSPTNKYIFNGDFVDRGVMGVEITLILLAFHATLPNSVFLNRGNHEDFAICCVYGFQAECSEKYDEVTFGMFVEVFQHLPLFTIINKSVLVVHGGLFHDLDLKLDDIDSFVRNDFTLQDIPEGERSRGYV